VTDPIRTSALVLVVDDDPAGRMLAAAHLKKAGFATVEAADGDHGVLAYERFRPDLILMDAVMPGMDGFAAILEIRKRPGGDQVPVLMMTGLEDISSIHRAYEVGATDFAVKPVNWVVLGHRLGYLLRSSRAFIDLAGSEEKTRALLRAIPDRIFRIDADGTILDLVTDRAQVAVRSNQDWVGRKLPEVLPAEAAAEMLRSAEKARASGEVQMLEYALAAGPEDPSFEARVVSIPDGESLVITRDITDRRKTAQRLAYMAYHDSLTGLPNRVTFNERLEMDLARAKRRNEVLAVVLLDLDLFKQVNDTLGHAAGDRLLVAVAERLQGAVRETDTVARMSGDEFCIILPDQRDENVAIEAATRIRRALSAPFLLEGQEAKVTASLGISLFPSNGETPEVLVKNADIAMFRAKAKGRDAMEVFSAEMSALVEKRARIEKGLRRAIEANEFLVYYQPEIDLRTGKFVGAEALVRWRSPDRGLLMPMTFIPVAEETGLIIPMSEWVIRTACAQAKAWQGQEALPFRIAANVSARLFHHYDLAKVVLEILGETGLDPGSLELEITESVAMSNLESSLRTLWKLHDSSIRIAMDDFGTGYSSLASLKKFPIHLLKIDRAFIKEMDRNSEDETIVKAIIAMAHALEIEVIAEGVERVEQMEMLKSFGCSLAQGFLFSKPLPAAEFGELLARNRTIPVAAP
jgi:diguanylate cyclase (GGDEF)-like protein